ncbi:uncharacterized protein [Dysidea avara]|uniref:uncharacterized protein n=1 Tax=Dysidea avara TaxID=196820 RepID=UPI00331DC2DD
MEEQTRLQASRSGYKGHVTQLFNKIDELVSGEFDDYTTTSLSNAIEQLTKKLEKITKIDDRLLELSKNATELELTVVEAEGLHDEISEKIARAKRFIELKNSAKQPSRDSLSVSCEVSPSPQLSAESQQNSDHLDNHQHVSEPTSISDLQLNTSQTHSSTVHVSSSVSQLDSVIVHHTMSSAPLTNTVFSHSGTSLLPLMHLYLPPLISAASYTYTPSMQQRPVKLSVPDVSSLYTSSVNHLGTLPASVGYQQSATIQQLPLANSYSLPVASSYSLPATNYHSTQQFATSRLPKLSLPTFSGDPLTWQAFWDSFFAAIHSNPSLSGIQKFNYLKAQLQGDAARAIEGLPLSELNYRHSISLLQDRFGQTHKLIDAHMKSLMSMASTNSLASLRMFYDSIKNHIRGLSSLGKAEHSYGYLLVPIIMGNLTTEVRI